MSTTLQKLAGKLSALSVYQGVLQQPVPHALARLVREAARDPLRPRKFCKRWGSLMHALCEQKSPNALSESVTQAILYDANPFSIACAGGKPVPALLEAAAQRDLETLREASELASEEILRQIGHPEWADLYALPVWETGALPELMQGVPAWAAAHLREYYAAHGCGIYAQYRAFIWRDKQIQPVRYPDTTRMEDLKGYDLPRQAVVDNTVAFLRGAPANNCLLYGDRGTGKSSTVKAILNAYYDQGLRVIEMPKEFLMDFPKLVAQIAGLPMKFLIFIDDLSFSKQDDTYASLKAVLEGGVAARPANTLIYATSNRRHLVRETFSDREGDEVHRGDSIQESLSLADRFGLAVNFSQPDKAHFLEIVRQLAAQRGLQDHWAEMEKGAEIWAIARGGRSPRCARQYVDAFAVKLQLETSLGQHC